MSPAVSPRPPRRGGRHASGGRRSPRAPGRSAASGRRLRRCSEGKAGARGPGRRALLAVSFLSLLALLSPAVRPAAGQLRRDPVLQPVPDVRKGELLLGVGLAGGLGERFPLAALEGDRLAVGRVTLALGIARGAVLEIRGELQNLLWADRAGEPAIPLDPGVEDGTTRDYGDFRVGVSLAPIGGPRGFAAGGRLQVKLPNSDERKGIGTNTTDVSLAALGSYGAARWRISGSLGVGILEAPLERFEQNDVLEYAVDWVTRPIGRLRLGVGASGRISTRGRVPLGTEDLGEARADAEVRLGAFAADLGIARGYAGSSADWAMRLGVAWRTGGSRGP